MSFLYQLLEGWESFPKLPSLTSLKFMIEQQNSFKSGFREIWDSKLVLIAIIVIRGEYTQHSMLTGKLWDEE